jgi:hypothetical protein
MTYVISPNKSKTEEAAGGFGDIVFVVGVAVVVTKEKIINK